MDKDIRALYYDLIDVVNKYNSLPWEVRRIVLDNVQMKAEKKADESIREELNGKGIHVDALVLEDNEDAENLSEDKLGKLPE